MANPELLCMGCMEERTDGVVCTLCGWREDSPPESPLYLRPRTILQEQYMIGRALGHGGFAVTYLSWDLNLARKLALKEYFPSGIATRGAGATTVQPYSGQAREDFGYGLEKFLEEARVLARFQNHPGIIAVLNFFRANGTAYLVMEYLEGITLQEYLDQKGGKIPFDMALNLMMPVMDALREVHKAGILHRDISPDNIYVTKSGQVKVLDFGAARYALGDRSKNLSIILKEGYAPQEQYKSKGNQGPWTDVYAVSATCYRAITGKVPPPALDRLDSDELESPTSLGVNIKPDAEAVLTKAMAVRTEERYPSIEDFQNALGQVTRNISDREMPVQETRNPKGSPLLTILQLPQWAWFSAAGTLAAAVLAFFFLGSPNPPSQTVAQSSTPPSQPISTNQPTRTEQPAPGARAAPAASETNPAAAPAQVNWVGKWKTIMNQNSRSWTCTTENSPSGDYRFSSQCPPPLAREKGKVELASNGTWKLQSISGRTDQGTYRVITPDQVEMSGQLGTAVWVRVASTAKTQPQQASSKTTPTAKRTQRERSQPSIARESNPYPTQPSSYPSRNERAQQQAQEDQIRRQQEWQEQQRRAQEEQLKRQQEQQSQQQTEQLINQGINILRQFGR